MAVGSSRESLASKLFLGKSGLLLQRRQNVSPDGLLQLRRRDFLVGTVVDPGFGGLAFTVLLELLQQFADASAQQATGAAPPSMPPEIAKQAPQSGDSVLPPPGFALLAPAPPEHLSQLVAVLVSGNREQSQQGSH